MRIIISPAKKMNRDTDTLAPTGIPEYLHRTSQLLRAMGELSFSEAKMLWKCNDKIAELNYDRIRDMDLERDLTPALLAYEGIQYQYMAPAVMEESQLDYLEEHLRILSGFYGILKPFDGVVPYRLEMQAKLKTEQAEESPGQRAESEPEQKEQSEESRQDDSSGKTDKNAEESGADSGQKEEETVETASQQALEQGYYIVRKGDSLLSISRKLYQTDAMVDEICAANGIQNLDVIYEGQKLKLP